MDTPRICYLGITKPGFSRSGVQIGALRALGVDVLECFDTSPGLKKFFKLFSMLRALRGRYDLVIVGYPGALVVPFVRIVCGTPVIFDAGWTLYEGIVLARGRHKHNPFARFFVWFLDRIAHDFAHLVLLDTDEQLAFYAKLLRLNTKKLRRLYTGCDERSFYEDTSVPKRTRFTAVFRGKYNIEAGLPTVLEAGRLLEKEDIDLFIYSPGYKPEGVVPKNVTIVQEFFPLDELRKRMSECHVSIGQMAIHERLDHTIPHKAFESFAIGIPYIAARSRAMHELIKEGDVCLMVPAGDPEALCKAIVRLRNEPEFAASVAREGLRAYEEKASWDVIATILIDYAQQVRASVQRT